VWRSAPAARRRRRGSFGIEEEGAGVVRRRVPAGTTSKLTADMAVYFDLGLSARFAATVVRVVPA
jgi:hypothetical protein